jgi:hypothetical protein
LIAIRGFMAHLVLIHEAFTIGSRRGGSREAFLASDQDLAVFVREHLRSVWAVELLLLLRKDAERCWSAAELVKELRASTGLVTTNLQLFERGGLVVMDEKACARFSPAAPVLGELCDKLADAYRERPVSIINLIAQPRDPLRSLADAFRFKRGEGE